MPEITHQFQSSIPDSPDATLVQPSNWNDGHVVPVTGVVIGSNSTTVTGVAAASQGQVLRRAYDPSAVTYQFATTPEFATSDFNFTAFSPVSSITSGVAATITLPGSILGFGTLSVNKHYLRIVDSDSAKNETVLLTAGTSSTQIVFTPTFSHTGGSYSIGSVTAGIQESFIFIVSNYLAGTAILPGDTVNVYAKTFCGFDSRSIILRGVGNDWSMIRRHQSYPAGDIFFFDGTAEGNLSTKFENFRVLNADNFHNTSGFAFSWTNGVGSSVFFSGITVFNGNGGYNFSEANYIRMNDCRYFESADQVLLGYSAAQAGLRMAEHMYNTVISDCFFESQYAGTLTNMLDYGVLIEGSDGIQMTNCGSNGKYGIAIIGTTNYPMVDLHITNHICDNCSVRCLYLTGDTSPSPFTNLHFTSIHCNGRPNATSNQALIGIDGTVDYIDFNGLNVNLGYETGLTISPMTAYHGAAQKSIMFNHCDFSGLDLDNVPNIPAIRLLNGVSGIKIQGCTISNRPDITGAISYGIVFDGTSNKCVIANNTIEDYTQGPVYIANGTQSNFILADNLGIDNVIPSVASASTVTFPVNPVFKLTGTTGVATVGGLWTGRKGQLVTPSGAVTFTAGPTIANTFTTTQNVPVNYFFDGTLLYLG